MTLSSSLSGSRIRYTLDGRDPTPASTEYNRRPIPLIRSTEVRAAAFLDGKQVGPVATAVYAARDIDPVGNLPVVVIDTFGWTTIDRTFRPAAFLSFGLHEGAVSLTEAPDVATHAGIHLRGQSSASFAKQPYRIEFRDHLDIDKDLPLLGMPDESDWVLRGPFADKS